MSIIENFEKDVPNSLLYPACDCTPSNEEMCISYLDKEFKHPGYLLEGIKTMVYEKLLRIYFNVPSDKTSNNNDETSR